MDSSSTQLVIVALPSDNDYVRKISSEKEPHLTLLYLGNPEYDVEQIDHIKEYVAYASTLINQFTLGVEHRGLLGDKDADVLFFNKRWAQEIHRFRENLLQDPLISAAYNSEEQFEGWTPHLTLGFPETPAKKTQNDYDEVNFVKFDRVALWTGESQGPTFELSPFSYDMEVAMSQIKSSNSVVSDVLKHHGVKGMHWGVRKSESASNAKSDKKAAKLEKKIAKFDQKFEKGAQAADITMAVYNGAANHMNNVGIPRINNKSKYRDQDFSESSKLRDEYHKEYEREFAKSLDNAAKDLGTNASGTRRYRVKINDVDGSWDIHTEAIKHEVGVFKIHPKYDDQGHVIEIIFDENSLAHHGVKGMKWGVRKSESSGGSPSSGGSSDHKNAEAILNKIDSGGTRSLSNQELENLLKRMDLERRYDSVVSQKHASEIDRGLEGVKKALKVGKTVEDVRKFMGTPTGKALKTGLSGAFAAGAAYVTGGTSAAATAGASVVIRRAANHYTNTGN